MAMNLKVYHLAIVHKRLLIDGKDIFSQFHMSSEGDGICLPLYHNYDLCSMALAIDQIIQGYDHQRRALSNLKRQSL